MLKVSSSRPKSPGRNQLTVSSAAITRLRLATKEVKQGNLDVAITEKTHGELGELVDDFNHMVRKLSETTVKKDLLQDSEKRLQLALQGAELAITANDSWII